MRAWHEREPFAFNGRYTKLRYVNLWPRPIQQPHPPIHIPGGGSIETFDFCIDNTYSYSYLSFGGYMRGQGADAGLLGSRGRAQRARHLALSRRFRADHLRGGYRRRSRAALCQARQLLLQSLPARVSRFRGCARLSHHQDHSEGHPVAVRSRRTMFRELPWKELVDSGT